MFYKSTKLLHNIRTTFARNLANAVVFVDCPVPMYSMSLIIMFDQEHVFDHENPSNEHEFPLLIMGWKYTFAAAVAPV